MTLAAPSPSTSGSSTVEALPTPTLTTEPHVREAGLVDVNAVVRLLQGGATQIDIDGDGESDGPADVDAAGSAARMALSHIVLQDGALWVAESAGAGVISGRPREILATSVWMPGSPEHYADSLQNILTRELHVADVSDAIGPSQHVRPQLAESMTGVMEHVFALAPRLVLFAVTVAPQVAPADVVALARAVVAPVIADGGVLAVALDDSRARLLRAVGFHEVAQVPLGELNTVWIGQA